MRYFKREKDGWVYVWRVYPDDTWDIFRRDPKGRTDSAKWHGGSQGIWSEILQMQAKDYYTVISEEEAFLEML